MVERGDVAREREHGVGPAERVRRARSADARPRARRRSRGSRRRRRGTAAARPGAARGSGRAAPRARRARRGRAARRRDRAALSTWLPRTTSVSAGSRPMNEKRPQCSPCSTDSSRNPSPVADELDEGRDRRLEVGEHLAPDRDDGVVARQRAELVERRLDGGEAHTGPGSAPPPKARKKQLRSPVWQAPRPSCSTTKSSTSMSQS